MPYIGSTRSKKIKKLYMLAKDLIHAYGLRYFFYVVRLELKKQKLSMFAPDDSPMPSFLQNNFQHDYNEYLKYIYQNLSQKFSNDSEDMSYNVSIIVLFDGDEKKLQLTIDSLQNQYYSNWNVLVLSVTSKPSAEFYKKNNSTNIKKLPIFNNDTKLNDYIKNHQSDFFCFLNTGILFDEFALSELLFQINHNDSDIVYSDHDILKNNIRTYPFFKPDWSPYLLRSTDFLSPFFMIKANIFKQIFIETQYLNCVSYDILLKSIELTNNISHVPLPLCSIPEEKSSKNKIQCNKIILQNHLNRMQINANVEDGIVKNSLRMNYNLNSKPKVSILIPTRNNYKMIKRCIDSIKKNTNYSNKEIIIIDNDSDNNYDDYSKLKKYYESKSYKIINFKGNFNFSKMNNFATKRASGELLLFLNDDTKVLDSNWLGELVSVCMQDDVGAVGPKLIFSDNTIQHAGMVFLNTGAGFHPGMRLEKNTDSYHNILNVMRDYSAVTGACLLVKKEIFDKIGGFDDQFDVYYGDSDLCLKIVDAGFRVIYTPFTELLHEGSNSIQYWHAGASFFDVESHQLFIKKWPHLKNGDPYYNSNLDWDYSISKKYT